jgi:GntR family transcriptional regulator
MPTSLYDALAARGLRPTWAEDSVSADVANEQEAEHLEVEPGTAVLRQTRRALSDDKIIEVSRSVYRADRFSWRVQLGQPH